MRASSSIKRPDDEIERVAQCAAAGRRKRRPWILTKLYRPETTYSWYCSYGNACLRCSARRRAALADRALDPGRCPLLL